VTREQLEHVIRAAAEITGDREIVVVGSTSILGQFPNAPLEMLGSIEADIYPRNHPERFEMLDVIGEMSRFQDTFGYYADPVQHDLPKLPAGWVDRLIPVPVSTPTGGRVVGLCLDVHDLVLSKYVASREKDREFNRAAIRHGLVQRDLLLDRLGSMDVDPDLRRVLRERIESDFTRPRNS
jgi:Nucleotidyltransferase of unknown function (DUF6036)